jgi:hypothetical protein
MQLNKKKAEEILDSLNQFSEADMESIVVVRRLLSGFITRVASEASLHSERSAFDSAIKGEGVASLLHRLLHCFDSSDSAISSKEERKAN